MRPLPLLLTALVIAAGAVAHGAATRRWAALAPDPARVGALHAHAVRFADCTAEEVPSEIEVKEKSTVTCRRYTSAAQGLSAVVSVTTGPAGAVSTHCPDVCYPSSGYTTVVSPKVETLDLPGGGKVSYYVAEFEKKTATEVYRQRVRWAWAPPGKSWDAPARPRFAYLWSPELFKLYVVTPGRADGDGPDDPPAVAAFVAAAFAQYAELAAGR